VYSGSLMMTNRLGPNDRRKICVPRTKEGIKLLVGMLGGA
jgi:hypothetical protein